MLYRDVIEAAKAKLEQSDLSSEPHVLLLWDKINWRTHTDQHVATDAEISHEGDATINLYPSLLKKPLDDAVKPLMREFGKSLFRKLDADARRAWKLKLGLPTKAQVDAFQSRLNQGFKTYREAVESLHTAMDRFVALNLANAMLSNKLAFAGSENVNVRTWGPTAEYAALKRYHSMIPMVSAYTPNGICDDLGEAICNYVCEDLNACRERSVASAFKFLIKRLVSSTR